MTPDQEAAEEPDELDRRYPPEIEPLAEHARILTYGYKDPDVSFPRDRNSLSLVNRDKDGEIEWEGELERTRGIYAFVRVSQEPSDPSQYESENSFELPDWAEWVWMDPPLGHMVDAVRCSECGAESTVGSDVCPGQVPSFRVTAVRHRPECSHADDDDRLAWARKHLADRIRSRPDPGIMALDCIWAEIDARPAFDHAVGPVRDAYVGRYESIHAELKRRLDPRYPPCPKCGDDALYMDGERLVDCDNCILPHGDRPDGLWQEVEDQRLRVWGWQGHGGRGRDSGGDES